ncbi:MAG: phenylalanine-4-hydroxylase [Neolewinella sp.]|jgi:phenylalanine-4-hydroxylase
MTATISSYQDYDAYAPDDYVVWRQLAERQFNALRAVACTEYLKCLDELEGRWA